VLSGADVREVQVTLDGPPEIPRSAPLLHNGLGTFARVAAGIDALLAAQIPVNLRVVVDREKPADLAGPGQIGGGTRMARPSRVGFQDADRTQLRTLRLRQPAGPRTTIRPLGTVDGIPGPGEAHPDLRRFHQPRLHGMHHLAETGEWPPATFDSCPAAKKEWAFAPDGGLYGCTATVGHQASRLGSYAPKIERDEDAIARWRDRNVFSIPACQSCPVASVVWRRLRRRGRESHRHRGSAGLRPIRELLGLGARYYRLGDD